MPSAALIVTDGIIYPMFTVARSALEIAAQAHYLAEPDIGAEERIHRHMNIRPVSCHEQRLLLTTFLDGSYEDAETAAKLDYITGRIGRVIRTAEKDGLEVTPEPRHKLRPHTSVRSHHERVSENSPTPGTVCCGATCPQSHTAPSAVLQHS